MDAPQEATIRALIERSRGDRLPAAPSQAGRLHGPRARGTVDHRQGKGPGARHVGYRADPSRSTAPPNQAIAALLGAVSRL
jgi:hypothetical protein